MNAIAPTIEPIVEETCFMRNLLSVLLCEDCADATAASAGLRRSRSSASAMTCCSWIPGQYRCCVWKRWKVVICTLPRWKDEMKAKSSSAATRLTGQGSRTGRFRSARPRRPGLVKRALQRIRRSIVASSSMVVVFSPASTTASLGPALLKVANNPLVAQNSFHPVGWSHCVLRQFLAR